MEKTKKFIQYASINFVFYITMTFSGYINVFLAYVGFNAAQVGQMTAINSGVGIFSAPVLGVISDKIRSVKKVIIYALSIGAVLFVLIPWVSNFSVFGISMLFFFLPIAVFFRQPVMSLIDNWMIRNARDENIDFGKLRSFGALSFALAAFALGYIIPHTGVSFIFYLSVALTIPAIILIFFVGKTSQDGERKKSLTFKEMQIGQLFKNYHLMAFIGFSILQRIPFQSAMIFMPFLIEAVDGDVAQLGLIMGIRAAVEIPVMLLLGRLRKKFPLYILIMVASAFFMTEFLLLSQVSTFRMVLYLSVLHGLGNGLMIPAGASYVFSLAPEHLKATTQTVLASITAISGILSGLIGGMLIMRIGIWDFFFIIGIVTATALGLFIISFIIGEKFFKIKRPGLSLK